MDEAEKVAAVASSNGRAGEATLVNDVSYEFYPNHTTMGFLAMAACGFFATVAVIQFRKALQQATGDL